MSDIDGVLADFYYAATSLAMKAFGVPTFPIRQAEAKTWDLGSTGLSSEQEHELFEIINNHDSFWNGLPETIPGITSIFNRLASDVSTLYFATTRPDTTYATTESIATKWLHERGITFPSVVSTNDKGTYCRFLKADYFVDDKWQNVNGVLTKSPDTVSCFLVYPYGEQYVAEAEKAGAKIIREPEEFIRIVQSGTRN